MARSSASTRPNKYGGDCDRCQGRVPSGEGMLAGKRRGRWQVRHVECNHEGARQVAPPVMSTGHNVGTAALAGPACGLTGVALNTTEDGLEGGNLSRRLRAQEEQRSRELAADEDSMLALNLERGSLDPAEVVQAAAEGFRF